MKGFINSKNKKLLVIPVILLAVFIFVSITGFKDKQNDRQIIGDKITRYMDTIKNGKFIDILGISGVEVEDDKKSTVNDELEKLFNKITLYEVRDYKIKKIDIQGAIAFVTVEETSKFIINIDGKQYPASEEIANEFRTVEEEIVLIKRDGNWKIDAVNTIRFSKIMEAMENPLKFAKLGKNTGGAKLFTLLADPDISSIMVRAMISVQESKTQGMLVVCKANERSLGIALEMYAMDHDGHFPDSLSKLVPEYIKAIPTCAAAGKDTYSDSYRVSKNFQAYTFYCKGHYHKDAGIPENYPAYDSRNGLILKGEVK